MSGSVAIQAVELIPSGFNEPKLIAVAGAVAVGGVLLDVYKTRLETQVAENTPEGKPKAEFADPFIAEAAKVNNRWTRVAEKAGYYAAVACATFALTQEADPFTSHPRVEGGASVVLDASYSADVSDMQGSNGAPATRLQASEDGILAAARNNNVPFSFILEGSSAQVVNTTPAQNKDLKRTKQQINRTLNPTFRNGESLANGVQDALPLSGVHANNIIIVASNISSKDVSSVQELKAQLKRNYPQDSLHAVVVGENDGSEQVGAATLNAPVDVQSFQQLLGAKNVLTARSSSDVQQAITKIIGEAQTAEDKQSIDDYGTLAIIAGALGLAVAVRRRLAGITKLIGRK